MPVEKSGRVVFIGNIPYGLSEEQITDLCRQAGPINSFRLVHDKETAKPKGFGFAEFKDADAAATAVRNLNGHEIMGRTLRVDYSNDPGSGDTSQQPGIDAGNTISTDGMGNGYTAPSTQPSLPQGTDLPPNLSCPDAISRTLSSLPPPQLLDILSQMKGVAMADPVKAAELFRGNPQLSYAMFQALLLLGLVDTSVLTSVVGRAQQNTAPAPTLVANHQLPNPAFGGSLPPPPPPPPLYSNPGHIGTPPATGQFSQPPVAPPVAPPSVDTNALKQQVMALQQYQIDAMAPQVRSQILDLRARIMQGLL